MSSAFKPIEIVQVTALSLNLIVNFPCHFQVNWLFWSAILISKTILFVIVYLASLVIGRRMDLGRAGIFAIFATQSNDFALGYPISKLTHSR